MYGVIDNVASWEHMIKFSEFLRQFHFPYPLMSAMLSVYIQLLSGIAFILGCFTRYAALLTILNFGIALIIVHRNDSIEAMTPALAILFSSILFLFAGPGTISIDKILYHKMHFFILATCGWFGCSQPVDLEKQRKEILAILEHDSQAHFKKNVHCLRKNIPTTSFRLTGELLQGTPRKRPEKDSNHILTRWNL